MTFDSSRGMLLCAAGLVFALAFARPASAGPVTISTNTLLTALVHAELSGANDADDKHDAQDSADLSKHATSAHAQAQLAIDTSNIVTTTGTVLADLAATSTGFDLSGSAATSLPQNNPFQANTTAVNNTLVPFTISDGSRLRVDYSFDVSSMVPGDQKITLALNRVGQSASVFHQIFTQSVHDSIDDVPAGSYQILVVTGSLSTAKGIPGDTGSAGYHVTVSASPDPPPAAIPLPSAALPGAITLGLVLFASRWRQHAAVATAVR